MYYTIQAGLCEPTVEPGNLLEADLLQPTSLQEKNPEKLSLALEPESASIECLRVFSKMRTSKSEKFKIDVENYMIVDCGGGTIDIVTHSIVGKNVEELAPPEGNFYGGTEVNKEFENVLSSFLDDPGFTEFLNTDNTAMNGQRSAEIHKLVYTTFEEQKIIFGDDYKKSSYAIQFPRLFVTHFKSKLDQKQAELGSDSSIRIEEDGWQIRFSSKKMEEFFEPCIERARRLLIRHIRNNKLLSIIDTIFWVGGFGGSNFLKDQLQKSLENEFPLKTFQYSTPPEPQLAVIRGATAFRCNPRIVQQRKSDATYGIRCRNSFEKGLHNPMHMVDDEEFPERKMCDNLFSTFVEKNESICTNEVFAQTFSPSTSFQETVLITLYSAPRSDVWYTTDTDVTELASIDLNLSGRGRGRKIEIIFDITHTEIQVCARDKQSKEEVKLVADFLSSV